MRCPLPLITAYILSASLAAGLTLASAQGTPPVAPAAAPPAASSPAPAAASSADNDAAAKHAKRTACLKDARAKKLVGVQRTAFVKQCVAAP
jgi:hypothetical protein